MNSILQANTSSVLISMPSVVDLNTFCDTAQSAAAQQTPPNFFEWLNDYVEGHLQPVDWSISGSRRAVKGAEYDVSIPAYERFLHVKASTNVQVMCGRCLQMMPLALVVDSTLQVFQSDEAADEAALADHSEDCPDPIVSSRQFDLIAQIQEELLLAIPENPVHDELNKHGIACTVPTDVAAKPVSLFASALAQQLNIKI
ncbi:MAG: hypothetical protein RI956_663 [Pseudomonadota bacterium]|jgi:uncharacterized protein